MAVEVIKPGEKDKQGNTACPQCGEVVLITNQWGDPPKCGKCDVPYVPKLSQPKYY